MAALHSPASCGGVFPNHLCEQPPNPTQRVLFHSSGVSPSYVENLGQFDLLLLRGICCTPEVCGQENETEPTELAQSGGYEPEL